MQLAQSTQNHILILTPQKGNLDATNVSEFKVNVINLMRGSEKRIILDLHHLNFIDSAGLGCFLFILRTVHNEGGELKLACMSKFVRSIFDLLSMNKIFDIFSSLEEALNSFKDSSLPLPPGDTT